MGFQYRGVFHRLTVNLQRSDFKGWHYEIAVLSGEGYRGSTRMYRLRVKSLKTMENH